MRKTVSSGRLMFLECSTAALALTVATSAQVGAQTTSRNVDDVPPTTSAGTETSPADIVVVGSRQSQQTANRRKKDARTATDSIVADDIGSFPDRNVNEAISRIPGVALQRNEFGEGDGVAVRGNGPDLTRVELDGLGVPTSNPTGQEPSRGADLRELPAELVKSVDVVKGSTADMTEGGLGGTVQIKTRSGLDFSKPYISARAGAQQNSLGRDWTPDGNLVAASRFLNDRVGVIASGTYSRIQNNSHGYQQTTSGNRGFSRLYDFDQSPEKTFVYNLDSLGTDLADTRFSNSTETPRSLLTKSIAARTKAECLAAFPFNPTGTNNQRSQRTLEQQSCLNQWNDATPSLIRNFTNTQNDQRYSIDTRLDFKVSDELLVFAKGTVANREVRDQNRSRNPLTLFGANVPGTFADTASGYPRIRTLSPNAPAGYALFDPAYGLNSVNNNATLGNVLNVVPGSVKVDANHNVTQMTLTNNTVNIDQIENNIDTRTKYAQFGAEYRRGRLSVDAFAGYSAARTTRNDMRTARNYTYGDATISLQPNGLFDVALPPGYDDSTASSFVQLRPATCISPQPTGSPSTAPNCIGQAAVAPSATTPGSPAYTVGQLPLVTPSFQVTYSPRLNRSEEKQAKIDLTYRTDDILPFVTRIKTGVQARNNRNNFWGNGGLTVSAARGTFGTPGYVPAVVVPTAAVRGSYRACQPTATSTVSCNYGFVPSTNPLNVRSGVDTLTPQQLLDLFTGTLEAPDSKYFGDLPNRGNLPSSWNGIRTDELFGALGASQFINFDCLITCVGSDGRTYEQPVSRTSETTKNFYIMADFRQDLPLGLRVDGNVGVRGVFVNVKGSGSFTLNTIRTTPAFNPTNPGAAAGISTFTFTQNVTLDRRTTDWLPSFNANLWGFDDKLVLRLYGGKTVARPPINRLLPAGSCTVDERNLFDDAEGEQFGCERVGNPGLKPFTAWNYNASLEWYPNADTLISATVGKLDVTTGGPIAATVQQRLLAGVAGDDPVTGRPLSELDFSVPTFVNGQGYSRDIYEFQAKTAFTFLPWFLRYTGVDGNVSILRSNPATGTQDPLSAEFQAPPNEQRYYYNASVWYDDGRLNIRLAYQHRSSRFLSVTPGLEGNSTDINYPGDNWGNVRLVGPGYNPGVARFADASTFIDAKIGYNVTPDFQVYLEGRNLGREFQTTSFGKYQQFEGEIPKITNFTYGGRRILAGARIQFGAPRRRR